MLISTAELEKIIDDPNLILIDARSFQAYSLGHITNAVNLDLSPFTGLIQARMEYPRLINSSQKFFHG